jgi:putative NADPH-quinone reductase
MKKILIILGHPNKNSYCGALASAYEAGAREGGHEVERLNLGELDFNPILHMGYKEIQELEPDLKEAQERIMDAQHLVLVFPTWWGTMPALLKGFFDRAFLPGWAFKYMPNSPLWKRLLAGRTARTIVTMDGPGWYYWLWYGAPGWKAVSRAILRFCGFFPVRKTFIYKLRFLTGAQRDAHIEKVRTLGTKGV